MASDWLFKETVQVYGSILDMGTLYVATLCSKEQVAAEIWICTKTPGISPTSIYVNQSSCKTPTDQWSGQTSSLFHIFVQ